MSEATTDLAVIGAKEYPILQTARNELRQLIVDNVGAGGMTAFDLERIKIPSGGMLAWEIPTITGKPEYVQEFDGVVIFHKDGRVYWEKPLAESGGNEPPDCSSADCVVGIGNPGGSCGQCPFARFGSDQQGGRGQACKQVKQLFVARSDGLLPVVLPLPPTSLSVARKYFLRLTSRRIPYYGVLTRFSLEKATNKGGIAYARAVLSLVEVLPDAQREALRQVGEAMRPFFEQVPVTGDDYNVEPDDEAQAA